MERLVLLDDGTYEVAPMADFGYAVAELVQIVTKSGKTTTLHSNGGIVCRVNARSNPRAFLEAHMRAMECKGPRVFGPELPAELSPEQRLSDLSLGSFPLRGRQDERNRVAVWNEIGTTVFRVAPGQAPVWREHVSTALGMGAIRFTRYAIAAGWRVACLAQVKMATGSSLKQCWQHALTAANFERVDNTEIVQLLQEFWGYGDELKKIRP